MRREVLTKGEGGVLLRGGGMALEGAVGGRHDTAAYRTVRLPQGSQPAFEARWHSDR